MRWKEAISSLVTIHAINCHIHKWKFWNENQKVYSKLQSENYDSIIKKLKNEIIFFIWVLKWEVDWCWGRTGHPLGFIMAFYTSKIITLWCVIWWSVKPPTVRNFFILFYFLFKLVKIVTFEKKISHEFNLNNLWKKNLLLF